MFLDRFFKGRRVRVDAHNLYVKIVEQARQPVFYQACGVPDTLDGRFDLIVMHVFMVLHRLRAEEGMTEQQKKLNRNMQVLLQEVLFADMDRALREMGVGDMGVGKRVKDMAQAFFGRQEAYSRALAPVQDQPVDGHPGALKEAIVRNLFRGEFSESARPEELANYMMRQVASLKARNVDDILSGKIEFDNISAVENAQ